MKQEYDLFTLEKTWEILNLISLGNSFKDIKKQQKITSGALSWHLNILKKHKLIIVKRKPLQKERLYLLTEKGDKALKIYFKLIKLKKEWEAIK